MAKKVMIGVAAAAAVVLISVAITGFPSVRATARSARSARRSAPRRRRSARRREDGDPAVQQFLQSDTFDRVMKDPAAQEAPRRTPGSAARSQPRDPSALSSSDTAVRAVASDLRPRCPAPDFSAALADANIRAALGKAIPRRSREGGPASGVRGGRLQAGARESALRSGVREGQHPRGVLVGGVPGRRWPAGGLPGGAREQRVPRGAGRCETLRRRSIATRSTRRSAPGFPERAAAAPRSRPRWSASRLLPAHPPQGGGATCGRPLFSMYHPRRPRDACHEKGDNRNYLKRIDGEQPAAETPPPAVRCPNFLSKKGRCPLFRALALAARALAPAVGQLARCWTRRPSASSISTARRPIWCRTPRGRS